MRVPVLPGNADVGVVNLKGRNSKVRFLILVIWHLWIVRARHPAPPPPDRSFGLELFNVGVWLTHGDFA